MIEAIQVFDGSGPAIGVGTGGAVPADDPAHGDWADEFGLQVNGRLDDDGNSPLRRKRGLHVTSFPLSYSDTPELAGAESLHRVKIGRLCRSPGLPTVLPGGKVCRHQPAMGDRPSHLDPAEQFRGGWVQLQARQSVAPTLHIGRATDADKWGHWLAGVSNLLRNTVAYTS